MEASLSNFQNGNRMSKFLSFSNWFYRGEGNKSLVISNPETRQVLRLQKSRVTSPNEVDSAIVTDQKRSQDLRLEFEKSIKFAKQVFIPLLSEKYFKPGDVVELSDQFMMKIKDLMISASNVRPKFRLDKEVNHRSKYAVLMRDFCFVSDNGVYANESKNMMNAPTYCVEIKPKCGTLPVCEGLEEGSYPNVKESICKYCLLQWTKVDKEGKYEHRSDYCPLDLFSSDVTRVWYALTCLLKNPQNNFKIFKDGVLVYSGEKTSATIASKHCLSQVEKLLRQSFHSHHSDSSTNCYFCGEIHEDGSNLTPTEMFLATILQLLVHDSIESTMIGFHPCSNHNESMHPICAASQCNDPDNLTSIPKSLSSRGLSFGQGGVLRKILDVQKLDSIGDVKALSIFNELRSSGHKDVIDSYIFTLGENFSKCCSKDFKLEVKCDEAQTSTSSDNECANTKYDNMANRQVFNGDLSVTDQLDCLAKFLVAATGNDCSIMISFQEVASEISNGCSYFEDAITGKVYKYSIAVVDVDQKKSDRIVNYHKVYHDIVDNYLYFNDY